MYHTDDPTIAATAWSAATGRAYACGTRLQISGAMGAIIVESVDACPGCRVTDIDLSEAGFQQVCGSLALGRCKITIEKLP